MDLNWNSGTNGSLRAPSFDAHSQVAAVATGTDLEHHNVQNNALTIRDVVAGSLTHGKGVSWSPGSDQALSHGPSWSPISVSEVLPGSDPKLGEQYESSMIAYAYEQELQRLEDENRKYHTMLQEASSSAEAWEQKNAKLSHETNRIMINELLENSGRFPEIPRATRSSRTPRSEALGVIRVIDTEDLGSHPREFDYLPSGQPVDENHSPVNVSLEIGEIKHQGCRSSIWNATLRSDSYQGVTPAILKLTKLGQISRLRDLRNLNNELQCLRALSDCLSIVDLYGTWRMSDAICMLTGAHGVDLYDFAATTRMTDKGKSQIMEGVVDGVLAIHNSGIAHRDLKPENILVMGRGTDDDPLRVKITDFGISVFVKDCERGEVSDLCGSRGFFPPEAALEGSFCPILGDLWSLGCVLLEMDIGQRNFGLHWVIIYEKIRLTKYPLPAYIRLVAKPCEGARDLCVNLCSPAMGLVVSALLTTSPADRMPANELKSWLAQT